MVVSVALATVSDSLDDEVVEALAGGAVTTGEAPDVPPVLGGTETITLVPSLVMVNTALVGVENASPVPPVKVTMGEGLDAIESSVAVPVIPVPSPLTPDGTTGEPSEFIEDKTPGIPPVPVIIGKPDPELPVMPDGT